MKQLKYLRIAPLFAIALLHPSLGFAERVCNLQEADVPAQCSQFKGRCPVLQSCVMDWVLRNEDIPEFDVGTLTLKPLDDAEGGVDEHTIYAEPQAPIVVTRSPIVTQSCKDAMLQTVTEQFSTKKDMPFLSAEDRVKKHMAEMKAEWSAKGWALEPSEVFAHLHHCKDVCGPMIAKLSQCHIWAVSNAPLKSLVTFDLDRHELSSMRETYPSTIRQFVESLPNIADKGQRYQVAIIGRASRDGDADHNYDLSYRRAHTIRDRVLELGVDRDDIRLIWLGEQPPQIHAAMVEGYELNALYRTFGTDKDLRINRSVLLVGYPVDVNVEVADLAGR